MTVLKLFLFGPPRVELDGAPVDLQRRKAVALLAYLAATGQPHSRDALATLFWPDLDQQRGRAYLRRDLAVLNNSLPGNWFNADREMIELRDAPAFWLDLAHFRRLLAECRSHDHPPDEVCGSCLPLLAEAAELYANDFMAGFTLPDSAEFDDWQFFQSEGLRQELASLLERLVGGLSAHNQAEVAIAHARRWVALDPLHEPAQYRLIWLYNQAGQAAAALRQYEEYARLLEEELGLSPEEETTTLVEAIKAKRLLKPFLKTEEQSHPAIAAPDLMPGRPLISSSGPVVPRHNLPAQPTLFIGREKELARIKQLLLGEPACRLLTLAGPGGIGKTRLAVASASAILYAFPQGVYFVSLASVADPGFIVPAIAEALGFNFSGATEPQEQLLTYLSEKNMLLLLDNFEHLLAGAELLSDILNTAPNVTLLVTSRERLNLQEEWSYEVEGMTFPKGLEETAASDLASLEKYSATHLFLQRARQAQANFNLPPGDIFYVVRICELVDGMPLGLELAAPWVRLMSCREIAAEIERNLDFLSSSLHNLPPRHRSVRAVFEQTWEQLPEEERTILSRLSIFRGGCQRQAAEEITGATLPRLLALVDRALLRRTESGRYVMHELIRQFSLEQLQTSPAEYEQVRDRHYAWYTLFLQEQTGAIKGSGQKAALDAITVEIDNVRTAWQRAVERKDALALGQAAECYCLYCEMRGALHEGETAFQQAAAAFAASPDGDPTEQAPVRGFLIAGQGMLAAHRGNLQEGQSLLEQGLFLLQQGQERERNLSERAFALLWLGWALFLQGKNIEAEEIIHQSLALFSEIGDHWGLARSLFVLGNSLTARGQLAQAEPPLRESLAICRDIDDHRSLLLVNRNLAILTLWFGDYVQTKELLDQAILLSREIGDQIGLAYTLRELGVLEVALGQYTQAIQTVRQSITITDEIGSRWESAVALDDLGVALRLTGDYPAAEWAFKRCLEASRAINNRYYTARCLGDLGCVAYHKAEYSRAGQLLHEALELWMDMGHEPYSAWILSQLGHVAAAGDNRDAEARHYYIQALQLSLKHNLVPFALDIFVGLARQMARAGDTDVPLRLLSVAERHPAGSYETRQNARSLLAGLAPGGLDVASDPAADWTAMAEQLVAGLL